MIKKNEVRQLSTDPKSMQKREWIQANKEFVYAQNRAWRKKNKEKVKACVKDWRVRNKDYMRDYMREWTVNRYNTNEAYRNAISMYRQLVRLMKNDELAAKAKWVIPGETK